MSAFFSRIRIALVGHAFMQATQPMHFALSTFTEWVKTCSAILPVQKDSDLEFRAFSHFRGDFESVGILLDIR